MSMPKEGIIGMVLEMYDARKEAKEYLEFYEILTRTVSWKSIRRLLQKNSIHQEDDRSQRLGSRFVGKLFLITRN